MKFAEFVCFDALIPRLKSHDRDGAITELVEALDAAGQLGKDNCKKVVRAVIRRENEASTGMGKGIAVPHVKHKTAKRVVAALGQSETSIDFSALDKRPVYSVILLISPADDPEQHLQAMEKIFYHLQQDKFRRFLRQARTTEAIEDLLKEADENPSW